MASEAPPFWWQAPDWRAYALYPVSAALRGGGAAAHDRAPGARRSTFRCCASAISPSAAPARRRWRSRSPSEARRMQLSPGFLSRGFGGKFPAPHVVDAHHDSARHVGDEPLLLAEHAPVAVTPDRAAGAKLLASRGCDFLIMDDGFQSARIHMDYALLVVDGRRGVGNGHVIPGGPMRAPLVASTALRAGRAQDRRRRGRRRHRAQGVARRPPGLRGAHRNTRSRPFCRPALSRLRRHRRSREVLRDAGAGRRRGRDDAAAFPTIICFTRDDLDDWPPRRATKAWSWSPRPRTPCGCGTAPRMSRPSQTSSTCSRSILVFDVAHTPRAIIEDTLAACRDRRQPPGQ